MLPSHNTPSFKKSIFHGSTLSKFLHSTMPGQNIKCSNAPSKSVICSTVESKRVNSDVNIIHKNPVNVLSDSVIARVGSRLPSSLESFDFTL